MTLFVVSYDMLWQDWHAEKAGEGEEAASNCFQCTALIDLSQGDNPQSRETQKGLQTLTPFRNRSCFAGEPCFVSGQAWLTRWGQPRARPDSTESSAVRLLRPSFWRVSITPGVRQSQIRLSCVLQAVWQPSLAPA